MLWRVYIRLDALYNVVFHRSLLYLSCIFLHLFYYDVNLFSLNFFFLYQALFAAALRSARVDLCTCSNWLIFTVGSVVVFTHAGLLRIDSIVASYKFLFLNTSSACWMISKPYWLFLSLYFLLLIFEAICLWNWAISLAYSQLLHSNFSALTHPTLKIVNPSSLLISLYASSTTLAMSSVSCTYGRLF